MRARTITIDDFSRVMELSILPRNNAIPPVSGNISTVTSSSGLTGGGPNGVVSTLGLFIAPDTTLRTWTDASNYCKSKNARLPSTDNLKTLWATATSGAVPNYEMHSRHKWPLGNGYGGGWLWYWTDGFNAVEKRYLHVPMNNANISATNVDVNIKLAVACVR